MDPLHRTILSDKCEKICETVQLRYVESYLKQQKLFNKYMWADIHSMHDVFRLLPTRGPEAFKSFMKALTDAGFDHEAKLLEEEDVPDVTYRFSSKPKGLCLLINNFTFDDNKVFENRIGAEKDAQSLVEFFQSIDYKVMNEPNLKYGELLRVVNNISREKSDVVILILMSHGSHDEKGDFIVSTDGIPIYKEKIIEMFDNCKTPHLQGKPKMFFFIACRGKKKVFGVKKHQSTEYSDSIPPKTEDISIPIPNIYDMLIIHSTLPGQVSVRDDLGTWFCQDFIRYLSKYYLDHDIEEIMKMVNIKLSTRVSNELGMQVLHLENLGFKKLYLCGLSNNN